MWAKEKLLTSEKMCQNNKSFLKLIGRKLHKKSSGHLICWASSKGLTVSYRIKYKTIFWHCQTLFWPWFGIILCLFWKFGLKVAEGDGFPENTFMGIELRHWAYINERMPNRATFFNDAKRRYGIQSLYNWLGVLKELNFDWINMDNAEWNLKNYFSYFEMIFEI